MPYSKLQTSLLLLYGLRQHEKAAAKLRQAIAQGQQEGDDRTVYTSLSLLGLGSLNSGRIDDALSVLEEIEGMITNRRSFVVGDETNFLEALEAQKLEVDRVRKLSSILAQVCRDPAFKIRLSRLASGSSRA